MSVGHNLILGTYHCARHKGNEALQNAIDQGIAMFPVLRDRLDDAAEMLSGFVLRILAIGRGLMASPSLIPLDEPSLSLAPLLVQEIFRTIAHLRLQGGMAPINDRKSTRSQGGLHVLRLRWSDSPR
jgi:branched-chain amino acid transport system ATP-binding protein